jgi:hypothetical protein
MRTAQSQVSPAAAANPRRFAHPPLVRSLSLFGVVFSATSCAAVLSLPFMRPGESHWLLIVCCLIVFVPSLVLSAAMVRGSGDTVEVTEEGLWYRASTGQSTFLAWDEIGDVQAQNVMQRLLVTDASGSRRIYLEYHLENFGELRRAVLERSMATSPRRPA